MSELDRQSAASRGVDVVIGLVLVALGLIFAVGQFLNFDLSQFLWPFFVIIPGLAFFVAMVLIGKNGGALAIPGSILTVMGLVLLYQNATQQWQTLSYTWTLIVSAVGLGLIIYGAVGERPNIQANGIQVAKIGFVLFIGFGVFFELFLNISGFGSVNRWVWPILLVGFGLYVLFSRGLGKGERAS